ncbi:MAG: NAD(P)-dependent oxidoreductase [Lachnospiraceae bacterium]|nr:NAD(P)-dependent oxidoreductase [Lachnospiraceae bacterium]MBQ9935753.1 NAD(P)-dependent oxidoreductase [Lachnospiraceae bacterium]
MINRILKEDLDYICDNFAEQEEFRQKTFLVTGATGLVGSVFVKALLTLEAKHSLGIKIVLTVRDEARAKAVFSDMENSEAVITYVVADMMDEDLNAKIDNCYAGNIDYILHAASITASKQMVDTPVDTLMIAVRGTESMLKKAIDKNAKMVYLSSMEMYGTVDKERVDETDLGYIDLSNVRNSYPEGKRMCECLCNCYAAQYDVDVCSARLAQTFGPGIPKTDNRVFAQFAKSAMNKEDIVMHTKGLAERNYCYIRDAVEALFVLLIRGKKGQAYNVVNEACHTTVIDMANMVCREFANDEIKVVFDIPESLSVYGYPPDVKLFLSSKKLEDLGWKPCIDLKDSYGRLIQYLAEED